MINTPEELMSNRQRNRNITINDGNDGRPNVNKLGKDPLLQALKKFHKLVDVINVEE